MRIPMRRFLLIDTFNEVEISWHKTLGAAVIAKIKHSRAVKRRNGSNSYIPTVIRVEENNITRRLTDDEHDMMLEMYDQVPSA